GPAQRVGEASGPVLVVHAGQRGQHHVVDGSPGREYGVLGNVADADAAAQRARAAVGRLGARENLPEGRLAGAGGPDEAGLVAFEQPKRQTAEERPGPVGLADAFTAEQERPGHPSSLLLLRLLLFLPHARTFRHGLTPSHRTPPRSALRRL